MSNHPNRSKRPSDAQAPEPEAIKAARERAGLSQKDAADLIYCTERRWQDWEQGIRPMHPQFWESFKLKAAAIKRPEIPRCHCGRAVYAGGLCYRHAQQPG